jgi:hypothetical protein
VFNDAKKNYDIGKKLRDCALLFLHARRLNIDFIKTHHYFSQLLETYPRVIQAHVRDQKSVQLLVQEVAQVHKMALKVIEEQAFLGKQLTAMDGPAPDDDPLFQKAKDAALSAHVDGEAAADMSRQARDFYLLSATQVPDRGH